MSKGGIRFSRRRPAPTAAEAIERDLSESFAPAELLRLGRLAGLGDRIIKELLDHPKLSRGQVWCRTCGSTQLVDSAECLGSGWPTCCGATMTVDAPDERGGG
jgi:hypothetical protein